MRVLIICARFPSAGGKGDQIRAHELIESLASAHRVTVLTAGAAGDAPPPQGVELERIAAGRAERALGGLAAALRGRPVQVGWMSPIRLRRAARRLARENDVVIAVTIRCLPDRLAAPTILDHIDALSANMRARARLEAGGLRRAAAALEAVLLARHERRVARWVVAQSVVAPADAAVLPQSPQPVVIPHLIVRPAAGGADRTRREIDVVFTGNMRYPPNRDAALWFAAEIVPRLRERRGGALRAMVAGRAAAELAVQGVEVASDVEDLGEVLRSAKVAAVPLREGTGAPTKLIEAAQHGAAVVSTPWAARAAGLDVDLAEDAQEFAVAIDRLLGDEELRARRAQAARAGLAAREPEAVRSAFEHLLAAATERRA